jgi:hypothetical protein
MIRARIALLAALFAAALPAQAMFGFEPLQTYYHDGDLDATEGMVVLVDDVNGDGLDDVLLAHNGQPWPYALRLAVFLQDPVTHELGVPTQYPLAPEGSAPFRADSIDAADLDGDGVDEIVAADNLGFSVLSPADGFAVTARFEPPALNEETNIARVADFDGDGKLDVALLTGSMFEQHVGLYRGDGAGHLDAGREALFPEQLCCLTDMRAVDFNEDGPLDIALHMGPTKFGGGFQGLNGIWGYANNGDGTFKTTNVVYPEVWLRYEAIGGLDVGDINGDGRPDLAGGIRQNQNSAINGVRAYFHGAAGRPYVGFRSWRGSAGEFTTAVKIRDMDADGKTDLVFAENTDVNKDWEGKPICYIEHVPSAGKYVYRYRHSCSSGPDSMAIGDINGDGLQDVVVADPEWGFGWTLGTNAEPIVNLVVGEGLSPGAAAFNLKNGSTTATIAAPSAEITYSVNRGKIQLTDWPQECSRPDPQKLRLVCNYADLAAGQSASGIVHYTVLQSQPYMQLHADAKAATTTEETVTSDNTATVATWIRQL